MTYSMGVLAFATVAMGCSLSFATAAVSIAVDDSDRPVLSPVGSHRKIQLPGGKGVELVVRATSRMSIPSVGAGGVPITSITFSFQNLFNTSTEPIEIVDSSINLWSGAWGPDPRSAPGNGEWKPVVAGAVQFGFRATVNPLDPNKPATINGSFIMQPKPGAAGNFSDGFAAYAFALVPVGGGQEIVLETGSSATDDMYSEEFNSIIGDTMVYTLVLRHRDCDPQGWAKCKACTCPSPPPHMCGTDPSDTCCTDCNGSCNPDTGSSGCYDDGLPCKGCPCGGAGPTKPCHN